MRNWNPEERRGENDKENFQPTYEELKPLSFPFPRFFLPHFQPTYEELKLDSIHSVVVDIIISSLPMRNWNPLVSNRNSLVNFISSLPMRNWNLFELPMVVRLSLFPAYLWGIETNIPPPLFLLHLHFQPTYEELKQHSNHTLAVDNLFPAYLWGIETMMGCPHSQFKFYFQPTYEELKPRDVTRAELIREISSLPMRNWNNDTHGTSN